MRRLAGVLLLVLAQPGLAQPARALALEFPGTATTAAERHEALGSYRMPVGPWRDGAIPVAEVEGELTQTAWRVQGAGLTTLQLMAPLRDQLAAEGYRVLYECAAADCGGFDFRYGTEVLPEPEMHVDLGDFRYLAAERAGAEPDHVSLLVSRNSASGFVQMTRVGVPQLAATVLTPSTKSPLGLPLAGAERPEVLGPSFPQPAPQPPGLAEPDTGGLIAAMETGGAVPLPDVGFATGSAELLPGEHASLRLLAGYLAAHPERRVMVVGHTDAAGPLASNITLSKRRAAAVVARLVNDFGVPGAQVDAQGVGFLSPVASNLTEAGRTQNRRVEVVLTSTQ